MVREKSKTQGVFSLFTTQIFKWVWKYHCPFEMFLITFFGVILIPLILLLLKSLYFSSLLSLICFTYLICVKNFCVVNQTTNTLKYLKQIIMECPICYIYLSNECLPNGWYTNLILYEYKIKIKTLVLSFSVW